MKLGYPIKITGALLPHLKKNTLGNLKESCDFWRVEEKGSYKQLERL